MSQFPILEWRVKNLKSIAEATVQLGGLSVVVGANSSGKSTLLQSILLAAQASRSDEYETAFPLSGPLIDLGDFKDIVHVYGDQQRMSIGGTFSGDTIERDATFGFGIVRDVDLRRARQMSLNLITEPFRWDIVLTRPSEESLVGVADLDAIAFNGQAPSDEAPDMPIRFQLDVQRPAKASGAAPATTADMSTLSGSFVAGEAHLQIAGINHQGGVPRELYVERERVRVLLESAIRMRVHHYAGRGGRGKKSFADARRQLIELLVRQLSEGPEKRRELLLDLQTWRYESAEQIEALFQQDQQDSIVQEVIDKTAITDKVPTLVRPKDAPIEPLAVIARSLIRFLSRQVHYLGPLREEPRLAYRSASPDQQIWVGKRGEATAYVLKRFGRKPVIIPGRSRDQRRGSLVEGVRYWMQELGAAEGVSVTSGRFGIELKIKPKGLSREVDLTAVGVGVSQVLPVVVLALLAEPGSILLLEQPELHLHPAMQQQLADFLIACSATGRQVLLETHSDHLVSRIRRRIAEDETNDLLNRTALIYAERTDGRTTYRRVTPSEYGTIEDWPRGFFDQAASESQAILRAGLQKRKKDT
jgi:predicted ATPase